MRTKFRGVKPQQATVESRHKEFILSCIGKGLSKKTVDSYQSAFHALSLHLNTSVEMSELTKQDVDKAIDSMRKAELSDQSIKTYIKQFKAFLSWANELGYTELTIPAYKAKETVKDTYSDEELKALLKRPDRACSFCEFRNWVIIQFLLNSGCRASTIRNIQNKDVDLSFNQVIFRHTKTNKIQVSPLSSTMALRLREYMTIRKGEPEDYLFCNESGEMLTENALRCTIAKYNKRRGVSKTSIHMFRHTFARKYLLDCNGNALTLQKLLGHSTLEMTKHYCIIFDTDISKNYDSVSPLETMTPKARIKK